VHLFASRSKWSFLVASSSAACATMDYSPGAERVICSPSSQAAGASPPDEDEDAHGDHGVQYCAPLGQRG
jgi:hypothetical protein